MSKDFIGNWDRSTWIKENADLEHENTEPLGAAAKTTYPYCTADTAYSTQQGGQHYVGMAIQPHEYIVKNKISWSAANAIKYLSRYKSKGGAEDVKKAIHYCQLLLKEEYGL